MGLSRVLGGIGFCFVLLCLVGCGDGLVEVAGTVKFDGQPIDDGSIRFEPIDQKSGTAGDSIKNGQYRVRVAPGKMKVTISAAKVVAKKKLYDTPDSPFVDIKGEALPEKYSDHQKTELQFDVMPGVNKKDWDLKK